MRLSNPSKAFIIGLFCLTCIGSAFAADVAKIGIVDIQRIMGTSEQGKAAKAQIKEQSDKMTQTLKQKGAEIEELKKQFERESMVMSKEKREEKEREFRIKLNDLKSLEKRYRGELQAIEKQLAGEMRKAVYALVEEIGKKEGYLLIINNFDVMYSPGSIDITDQLIKELNARYKK
ncbi:MAG: OmpH family outer membrane protein [Desulfobacterales bacterium]|jgi:outer membrane protein